MPYSSHKSGHNKITVTKKDTGEVVGHTTPEKYKAYMAALHIHDNAANGGFVGKHVGDHEKEGTPEVVPYQKQPPVEMAEGGVVQPTAEDIYRKALDTYQKGNADEALPLFKQAQAMGHPYAAKAVVRATSNDPDLPQMLAQAPKKMAEGGIVAPYPEVGLLKEEESAERHEGEHIIDGQFLAEGGFVQPGDFDVNGGDSTTFRGMGNVDTLSSPPQLASGEEAQNTHIQNAQVADPTALRNKATNPPATNKVSSPLPGMPSGISSEDIEGYLGQKKQQIKKYGPDEQMAVANSLLKARTGLGGGLAQAGGGLADAIMQGVARAGPSNFQKNIQEQGQQVTGEALGAMKGAHEQGIQQTEAEMKLDASDPNSPPSKAAQGSIGQVLISKMGYSPRQVGKMSAQEIETTANLAMKYEEISTQEALKEQMIKYQAMMGGATIQNQQMERELQAATLAAQHPFLSMMGKLPTVPGAGGAAGGAGWKYIGKVGK